MTSIPSLSPQLLATPSLPPMECGRFSNDRNRQHSGEMVVPSWGQKYYDGFVVDSHITLIDDDDTDEDRSSLQVNGRTCQRFFFLL